jgi:hypothetical protein
MLRRRAFDLRGTKKQGLEKATKLRFLYVFTKYYSGEQIKKKIMGGTCSTYGGPGEVRKRFG